MSDTNCEILFRGKRADNGKRIYGALIIRDSDKRPYIVTNTLGSIAQSEVNNIVATGFKVCPETLGQFTGLYDATKWEALSESEQEEWLETHTADEWKGRKIFEGDIVAYDKEYGEEPREKGVVYWCDGSFWVENVRDEEDVGLLGVARIISLKLSATFTTTPNCWRENESRVMV